MRLAREQLLGFALFRDVDDLSHGHVRLGTFVQIPAREREPTIFARQHACATGDGAQLVRRRRVFERHPDTLVIIFQEIDERDAFGQVAFGGKGAEGEHPARIRCQLKRVARIRILEQHRVGKFSENLVALRAATRPFADAANHQRHGKACRRADDDKQRSRVHRQTQNALRMLDQRTFLREVHDSPIVHIEANRREKGHVAVLLAQHDRCHISLVLDAGAYIGDLIGRHAPSLKHLVQGGSPITFEFLRHGNDGSVLFDQQRAKQRNLRARLARIQKLLRFYDAAQHTDHASVASDGLGDAEVVAVQAVRLAHVGHHRLACVQMPKRFLVPLVAIARNALLQRLDWSIGNLERPLLVPFL